MDKYSKGDDSEDLVDDLLHSKWKRPYTKINRSKDSYGRNKKQTIVVDGETFILPDITVFLNKNLDEIEIRVEVKSFNKLPTLESPNRNLPLFPLKVRQLEEYSALQASEEVGVKIVFVIGGSKKNFYWCNLDDVTGKLPYIISDWDGEFSCWYNLEDMNSSFDNF